MDNNIKDVVIIVGYKAEQIEAKIKDYQDRLNINSIQSFFDCSNNLISVWMARHYMDSDFITINGDDVFTPSVVENLLKCNNDITMVIDQKELYDDDDMKVVHAHGNILEVSKTIDTQKANGESIGMIKFSKKGPSIYKSMLEEMVRDPNHRNSFYLKAIQRIIDKGYVVNYSVCNEIRLGRNRFPSRS
jgi:choline kinase